MSSDQSEKVTYLTVIWEAVADYEPTAGDLVTMVLISIAVGAYVVYLGEVVL